MRRGAVLALTLAGAAAVATIDRAISFAPLAGRASARVAQALGLPRESVSLRPMELGLHGMRVTAVRVGPISAADAVIAVDLLGALIQKSERVRVTLHGLVLDDPRAPKLAAKNVAVELERGVPPRAAFSGGSIGDRAGGHVDDLAGAVWRDGRGFQVRAARPGLVLTARALGDDGTARMVLDGFALSDVEALGRRLGLRLDRAKANGSISLALAEGTPRLHAELSLTDVGFEVRAVAPRPLGPLTLEITGDASRTDGVFTLDALQVALGPVKATLSGRLAPGGEYAAELALEPIGCGELLRALPRDLLPTLDGLVVEGTLSGRLLVDGARARPGDLRLAVVPRIDCKVLEDPPLADVRTLRDGHPIVPHTTTADGKPRKVVLGPENPSWRGLRALPDRLPATLVAAEDSGFFRHHGFDVADIRAALAADIDSGRFERGGSTISQQVVKNLFLSGERTAARKLEEAVLVWRLEQLLTKRRILELYVNLAELGPGVYGVAEAANRYFGKEPEELSLDEATQLAALLPAPRHGMDAAWQRRYNALRVRIPHETVTIPPPPGGKPVRLTRR